MALSPKENNWSHVVTAALLKEYLDFKGKSSSAPASPWQRGGPPLLPISAAPLPF